MREKLFKTMEENRRNVYSSERTSLGTEKKTPQEKAAPAPFPELIIKPKERKK